MTEFLDADLPGSLAETPAGWRLRPEGTSISYRYVGLEDFAFEIWQDGDRDVTVRLLRPFTFGIGAATRRFDPGTVRKSDLAPLLELGSLQAVEVFVGRMGELQVMFSDASRLNASPAADFCAWRLEWPVEGDVLAEALPGGGLAFPGTPAAVASDSELDQPEDVKGGHPIRRGANLDLPIAGLITMAPVTDLSIELMGIESGTIEYCIHFGGPIEITGPDGGTWRGQGDSDHRSSLARVLDLVGGQITGAHMDGDKRLHLVCADGTTVVAEAGRWEAHWPQADAFDDVWVPSVGPNIP